MSSEAFPILKRGPLIEVGRPRRGRPSYAWVQGWIVERAAGIESMPMRYSEARAYMRQCKDGAA